MRTALLAATLLAGCSKNAAPEPAVGAVAEQRQVSTGAEVAGAAGVRAVVTGTVERRPLDAGEGTALVLSDGALVFVSTGEPPPGWDWLVGTQVRVQGLLWERAPDGPAVAWLADPEAPMPADVQMGL